MNRMQKQVKEFIDSSRTPDCAGLPASWPGDAKRTRRLCYRLIHEEVVEELLPAILDDDWEGIVDGACDALYVILFLCNKIGVNIEPFFDAVHRANMRKFDGPLDPVTGKQLKPEEWTPPPIATMIEAVRKK